MKLPAENHCFTFSTGEGQHVPMNPQPTRPKQCMFLINNPHVPPLGRLTRPSLTPPTSTPSQSAPPQC